MMKPQFIEQDGKRTFAVIPYDVYEEMVDALALQQAQSENEVAYPAHVAKRIAIDEESPLKVLREWRGLTQEQLADKARLSKNYISMLETGKRPLSKKTAVLIAGILGVEWDMLS